LTADTLAYDATGSTASYEEAMQRVEADPGLLERTREAHQQFVATRQATPAAGERAAPSAALGDHGARLDRAWERLEANRAARELTRNDGEDRSR
jgi:hypothetical protein